jgi:hypothetical protein
VFVADWDNFRVLRLPARSGRPIAVAIAGRYVPIEAALNTTGDLFVTDLKNQVLKLPAGSDTVNAAPRVSPTRWTPTLRLTRPKLGAGIVEAIRAPRFPGCQGDQITMAAIASTEVTAAMIDVDPRRHHGVWERTRCPGPRRPSAPPAHHSSGG